MLYIFPDYYREFSCLADRCEETCCALWRITVDEQSLKRYRALKGPVRRRLLISVDRKNRCFRQDEQNRCLNLTEDNLCRIQQELGPRGLCRSCRLFPRHVEEFRGVRELSLSMSCPEAARIILSGKQPVLYRTFEKDGREERPEEYKDFDETLFASLRRARAVMLSVLQNRELSLPVRAVIVTGAACSLQIRYREDRLAEFPPVQERMSSPEAEKKALRKLAQNREAYYHWIRNLFEQLPAFECFIDSWPGWLEEVKERLYMDGPAGYEKMRRSFSAWMHKDKTDWDIVFEQLMVYFLMEYFCGSVYDGRILTAASLAAAHTWILADMLMAVWNRNEGEASFEEFVDLCVRYSRQMEHSDRNVREMERIITHSHLPWIDRKKNNS